MTDALLSPLASAGPADRAAPADRSNPPRAASRAAPLLRVTDLKVHFPTGSGRHAPVVRAVDGVSFDVPRNTIVGLVGESGSGKTTTGRALLKLVAATAGRIEFDGQDLSSLSERQMLPWRRRMQIVFQDPYASLNPRMSVAEILGEALDTHKLAQDRRDARISELLERVGLNADHRTRYPHEFSGGQRQRIGIARALAVEPDFIVADEPVSALDVSVQAQVLNLLQDLQRDLGLTMLFVAHDLAVVDYLCDEVVVMYLGHIMERGPTREVYARPRHPYTRALLSAAPVPDPRAPRSRILLKGDIPSPIDPPSGCVFRTRCPHAADICAQATPTARPMGPDHYVACVRLDEIDAS
ncbi:ATP-binding cassette domain-containing protein [Alcaligenaceae bacterium B3P038]|nr:ATP-binding cassette domain-containing protein [Alcaligenaceae bacterium B3P038]